MTPPTGRNPEIYKAGSNVDRTADHHKGCPSLPGGRNTQDGLVPGAADSAPAIRISGVAVSIPRCSTERRHRLSFQMGRVDSGVPYLRSVDGDVAQHRVRYLDVREVGVRYRATLYVGAAYCGVPDVCRTDACDFNLRSVDGGILDVGAVNLNGVQAQLTGRGVVDEGGDFQV